MAKELKRIHSKTHKNASVQFAQARILRTVNLIVGLPAAAVAAVAAGLALSGTGNAVIVGVLALASATLGSLQTVLGVHRRQLIAERSGNSYLEVRNAARILWKIDLREFDYDEARRQLDRLTARYEEINRSAEPPSAFAFWRGRRFANNVDEWCEEDKSSGSNAPGTAASR